MAISSNTLLTSWRITNSQIRGENFESNCISYEERKREPGFGRHCRAELYLQHIALSLKRFLPKDVLSTALEMGVCFHRDPAYGKYGRTFLSYSF